MRAREGGAEGQEGREEGRRRGVQALGCRHWPLPAGRWCSEFQNISEPVGVAGTTRQPGGPSTLFPQWTPQVQGAA